MIKPIIYNPYIDLVGIEFEGLFTLEFKKYCHNNSSGNLIYDLHSDCSVNCVTPEEMSAGYSTFEVLTQPAKGDKLAEVLQLFSDKQLTKDYNLNKTCGLHFHVSLNKAYYAYIDNQEFYDEFVEMFKTNFPDVYKERKNQHYCKVVHSPNHFKLCSQDRYASVNYCYTKHKTVEFRCYGGSKSTVEGLADMIQKTLNLIGDFIERREAKMLSLCQNIEVELLNKKYARIKQFILEKHPAKVMFLDITDQRSKIQEGYTNFPDTTKKIELNIDLTN